MDSHAIGTLQYIRRSMESAGLFAVPGLAGIVMGGVGILAAIAAALPALASHSLLVWLCAALVAFACGAVLIARQNARAGTTLYRGPTRKFVLCLAPSLLAGVALTVVLLQNALQHLLPGTWLLLYGCGVLSASSVTARLVAMMGCCFLLLSVAAFALPTSWANAALGAGFGGLHLVFGFLMMRRSAEE